MSSQNPDNKIAILTPFDPKQHAMPWQGLSRREFLVAATSVACASAAWPLTKHIPSNAEKVVLEGVDSYRVSEPLFEGVRIVLDYLGDKHTPAYVQGISGAAFRIAGPCPCAPSCSTQMDTKGLLSLLGYEYSESILGWKDDLDETKKNMVALIPKVKDSIRAKRPVLLWYAFADTSFEVVSGFDEAEGVFIGRHAWQRPSDVPAKASQGRAAEAVKVCPAFGALFVGANTGAFDPRAAEVAALNEAVRHAHEASKKDRPGRPPAEGLATYSKWIEKFSKADAKRDSGDSYCIGVYRSTHRAAAAFCKEIAAKHPRSTKKLLEAAKRFAEEADALDLAAPMLGWRSPELDSERNAKIVPLLKTARERYASAIGEIEKTLP
jgi:hypothetical protein